MTIETGLDQMLYVLLDCLCRLPLLLLYHLRLCGASVAVPDGSACRIGLWLFPVGKL